MNRFISSVRSTALLALAAVAAMLPMATMAKVAAAVWELIYAPGQFGPKQLATFGTNTLTGLIPTLYEALNVVSREMIGFIPGVTRDSGVERAALNQTVRSPVGLSGPLEDITPGTVPASTGDTTVGYVDITISKSKAAPIRWNGEEERAVGSTGVYNKVLADQFAEGMRLIVNAMETDLATVAMNQGSRAYGTAGTAPFGTAGDLTGFAGVLQIIENNGVPKTDLQVALGSAAMFNLRGKQSVLFKVNEAGSNDMLRNGMTDRVMGFALRNSSGVGLHTKGTGTAYVTSGSSAIGTTQIVLATGAGTVVPGDVVTFAGDSNNYNVVAGVAAPGTITIAKPGLLTTVANGTAMTIGASYTGNVAFARTSLVLAARAPAVPSGGDAADDSMMIVDPLTGIPFEVRVYRQYRQVKFEICAAWGVACSKQEHVGILMG